MATEIQSFQGPSGDLFTSLAVFHPVQVDLRISIDVSGDVSVLGVKPQLPESNIVIVRPKTGSPGLKASSLFGDLSDGIIEFWEGQAPTGASVTDPSRNEVQALVAAHGDAILKDGWTARRGVLISNFQDVLCTPATKHVLDASDAYPFSSYKAGENKAYYEYNSIGEMMLGYAAERLFGHPAASAAIDNDTDIIAAGNLLNGTTSENTQAARVAEKLVEALEALSPESATKIAMEVLGQDATRGAVAKDNNGGDPEKHAALVFRVGDIVYVGVNFKGFEASLGAQAYQSAPTDTTPAVNPAVGGNTLLANNTIGGQTYGSTDAAQKLTVEAMKGRLTAVQYYLEFTLTSDDSDNTDPTLDARWSLTNPLAYPTPQ